MATLKFFLKEPKSKSDSLIFLFFQYGYFEMNTDTGRKNYKPLKMSSGESIEPKNWNPDKNRARESRSFTQGGELNSRLDFLENTVLTTFRRLKNDEVFPTPAQLKEEVLKITNKEKHAVIGNPNRVGFFQFIEQLIEDSKSGDRLTPSGKQYSIYTIKSYVNTLNNSKDYQKSRKQNIDFEIINMEFYNKWVTWMYRKNKSKNTVGKHVKNLKVFMQEAFDKKITKNDEFKDKRFKVLEEDSEEIYLTNDELDRILGLDLSDQSELDLARDNFLLDCYIGLRIADYKNLRENHIITIEGTKMIKIRLQKTGNIAVIPLNKKALKILEKRNYDFSTYPEYKINKLIKEVGKLAGIDEPFIKNITLGGKVVEQEYKKYEKITNHTARRSFATNLYLEGVPTLDIMQMTGHTTEKAFLKYIRVTPEQTAIRVSKMHAYFSVK
jgi:integrase